MKGTKVMKSGSMPAVRGGGGKMFGKQGAKPQTPGQTASMAGTGGGKFASGGGKKMVGKQSARPQKAGVTSTS